MKKILFAIMFCIAAFAGNTQVKEYSATKAAVNMGDTKVDRPVSNIKDTTCFCCGQFYNLPSPTIFGSDILSCKDANTYSTRTCPDAKYSWTVSPAIPFTGQGTNTIKISPAAVTGTYTICVTISCGNQKITSCKTVKADCCDCSKLPKATTITGPTNFCISTPCDQILNYSVPEYGTRPCYAYQWSVSPAINITGQGTNKIGLNCSVLRPGTYTITVVITCGTTSVTSTTKLVVCGKPNPSFSTLTDGNSVTFTSTQGCTNLWYFFEDKNSNCLHDAPAEYPVTGQSGNSGTFGGLVDGKDYMVYHYIQCSCGNGVVCQSMKAVCFKYLPEQMMKTAKGAKGIKMISEKTIENMQEIPAAIKKEIEKATGTKMN